jgi:two-component system phosphate regulon sensor histidine kinase PhoR
LFLNQLVWSQEESYFTKTYDPAIRQDVWMVISPVYDTQHQKIGLANFKVSTSAIDTVIDRTSRDAIVILFISVIAVILLIINHLRLFERSLMVDKLQQIDKMKDDFISVASHELKTPLTAIKGSVSIIRGNFKNNIPPELTEWFDMINDSVARLNDLVNDLLNVSRIEQNRLAFELSSVDSAAIITEVVNQLKFSAQTKSLQLIYQPSPVPLLVQANPNRFREVMVNLIGNAIKYTLTGSVTIREITEDKTIRFIIQDTGVGIAPEDKEKLFQKFSRVFNEKTRDVPGSGLGLWITKAMIERMNGKIYVDSVLDQGTVFTVVLNKTRK